MSNFFTKSCYFGLLDHNFELQPINIIIMETNSNSKQKIEEIKASEELPINELEEIAGGSDEDEDRDSCWCFSGNTNYN